jgi:hypothetical protein
MTTTSYNIYQQITSVRLASTANIPGNYFNGALNNGVGATLTALTDGHLSVDGVLVDVGDRLLLKDQTNANQNGLYVVQTTGSAIGLWMLERAPDFQSLEQLKVGQYFSVGGGNTFEGSMYVLVEPLPSIIGMGTFNFVNVADGAIPSGPYLLKANNLSDVQNSLDSFENLGFGAGGTLFLLDADFPGGVHTLTNPCPNVIRIQITLAGSYSLKLPPAQGAKAFQISQGPIIINSPSSQLVDLQDSSGFSLDNLNIGACLEAKLSTNSTISGTWNLIRRVLDVNGVYGDVSLTSSDSSITITTNPLNQNIDLSASTSVTTGTDNIVWIGTNGSDITGTGTFDKPYATLSHAMASITTASSTNPFKIEFGDGSYTDTNVALKPWIFVDGNQAILNITGSVTLHSSWSSGGEISFNNFNGLSLPATVTLDFNSLAPPLSVFVMKDNVTSTVTTMNILGSPTGTITIIEDNFGFGNEITFNVSNAFGAINGGASGNISLTDVANYSLSNMTIIGNFSLINTSANTFQFFQDTCKIFGTSLYQTTGSGELDVTAKSMQYFSAPTLDNGLSGGSVKFDIDILEALPTLLNGATYFPTSIADAMGANQYFTPVHYTRVGGPPGQWTANSVVGNLAGIDAQLGDNQNQLIYVNAASGNDSNDGNINRPMATYEAARLLAVSRSASASAPVYIYIIGSLNIVGDFTVSPFIYPIGSGIFSTNVVLSGNIVLDASWNTTPSPNGLVYGINFAASSFNLIYTIFQAGSVLNFVSCCTTLVPTATITGSGTSISGIFEQVVFLDCIYNLGVTGSTAFTSTNIGLVFDNTDLSGGVTSIANTVNSGAYTTILNPIGTTPTISASCSTAGGLFVQITGNNNGFTYSLSVNGPNVVVNCDVSSWEFNLTLGGGATLSQIQPHSSSNGLNATAYSPLNFTPVGDGTTYDVTSQTAYNRGIDNALGALGGRVITVLGNTSVFQDTYPSGVTTSVWQTLVGTNTVVAGSLAVGNTVELTATGFLNSVAPAGTGIITFNFGSLIMVTSQVITRTMSVTTPIEIRARITLVNPTLISASVVGYYTDEASAIQPILMVISPFTVAYNPLVSNNLTLTWTPTYVGVNSYNLILPNLNIIQYN